MKSLLLALVLASASMGQNTGTITATDPHGVKLSVAVTIVQPTKLISFTPTTLTVESGTPALLTLTANQQVPIAVYPNGFTISMTYGTTGCTGPGVVTIPAGLSSATATVTCTASPVALIPFAHTVQAQGRAAEGRVQMLAATHGDP
jgi:hypothetical protein